MTDVGVPPPVEHRLDGWELAWFRLRPLDGSDAALAVELERTMAAVRAAGGVDPTGDPVVAGVRRLFRAAGTDPTRHRPSSEALLRRVARGEGLPRIHPLVDLNNLLSLRLRVPCCILDQRAVAAPFVLRAGREGETMQSLRGPFNLEGKPLLEDREGPFGTPITDSERVRVGPATSEALLVAYLPAEVLEPGRTRRVLEELLADAPVAWLLP